MATTEIKLANPVEIDGEELTALKLRLPTVEDYTAVRSLNVGAQLRCLKLIARLSGVETRALERIFSANEAAVEQTGSLLKDWFGFN